MASTYSTNLSLELPGTGDQSGTWGTTANRDMGTLLEQAISGFVEQQFNTDADITLTILSGADGGGNVTPGIIYGTSTPGTAASPVSARNMYIRCTGTLTAARVLTVPTNRKLYYIYNNTTGGFALTVKTAAGSGISVPNGSKMLLVCDGTNIVESIDYFSSLTFGNLTVTGNVTLSGGTANGVAYLNGSKVVTTGTALTYDGSLLTTSGYYKVGGGAASNTARLMVNTPSGTAAGIQLYQDANESWVIQNPASSTGLAFANSGSEKMRLDATGNLGIGTTSPSYKLHIVGTGQTLSVIKGGSGSGQGSAYYVQQAGSTNTLTAFGDSCAVLGGTPDQTATIYTYTNVPLTFTVSGSEKMRLDASGNLGIGTSSPGSYGKFTVQSNGAAQSALAFVDSNTSGRSWLMGPGTGTGSPTDFGFFDNTGTQLASLYTAGASGKWNWYTNNTERMRLTVDGNLGIGTTSPGVTLDVNGSARIQNSLFVYGSGDRFNVFPQAAGSGVQLVATNSANSAYAPMTFDGIPIVFNVASAERMRLDSSGYLGIGTNNPSYKLDIVGSSGVGMQIYENSTGNNNRLIITQVGAVTTYNATYGSGSAGHAQAWQTGNVERLRLDTYGNLGLGVVPSAWAGGRKAIQISSPAQVVSADLTMELGSNWYYNGTNYVYTATNPASLYSPSNGTHAWYTAPSGTGGTAATFTQTMTLDDSGRLMVGYNASSYGEKIGVYTTGSGTAPTNLSSLNGALVLVQSAQGNTGYGGVGYTDTGGGGTAVVFGRGSSYDTNIGFYTNPSTTTTPGAMTQRMIIDSNGNVGVNAIPGGGYKLYVYTTGTQNCAAFRSDSGQPQITVTDDTVTNILYTASGACYFGTSTNHPQVLLSNGSERARITAGGQFLVGGTNAAGFETFCASNVDNTTPPISSWNRDTTGNNYFIGFWTEGTATIRGSITYNRAGGLVAYNTTSDYRAKDILGPVADSGSVIDSLSVYTGKMKGADIERPMMVAHEAQAVAPYAVTGEKDAVDKAGKPVFQQIDYSTLVPLLIAEIQSLRTRVAQLEGR